MHCAQPLQKAAQSKDPELYTASMYYYADAEARLGEVIKAREALTKLQNAPYLADRPLLVDITFHFI